MFNNDDDTSETPATKQTPAPAPAPERAPSKTDLLVDVWFVKHFHGLGAKLDEPLFNHLRAAKEDLKSILAGAHQ